MQEPLQPPVDKEYSADSVWRERLGDLKYMWEVVSGGLLAGLFEERGRFKAGPLAGYSERLRQADLQV